MDTNGRSRRYVANGGRVRCRLSPDGKRLACLRKGALFVLNVDGSGGRTALLKPSFGVSGKVDWSPDGSRILFHSDFRLFTIRPDGTGLTQLTRKGSVCSESFSPDGSRILALGNCESETDTYLLTMKVDGSGVTER